MQAELPILWSARTRAIHSFPAGFVILFTQN